MTTPTASLQFLSLELSHPQDTLWSSEPKNPAGFGVGGDALYTAMIITLRKQEQKPRQEVLGCCRKHAEKLHLCLGV